MSTNDFWHTLDSLKMLCVKKLHGVYILAMLLFLSIANVSCSIMKRNAEAYDESGIPATTDTRKAKTPGAVWRNNGSHSRSWANRAPKDDDYYDGGYDNDSEWNKDISAEQWKKLDFKLGRRDNKALYREVKSWLGTPYRGGGHKKQEGTDCSGFVMEIYLTVYKMALERRGSLMFSNNCEPIDKNSLREGDLVFFHDGGGGRISHVGLYLKDNKFAHASSSRGVIISDLNEKYYLKHYFASGRVKR